MDRKKLIYVSSPYTGAVVEGQVYELLEYYKQQDWFEDVLLLQSYSSEEDRKKGEITLEKFTFRKKFFWMNPYYPHLYLKSILSMRNALKCEVTDNTVFHVRNGNYAYYVRNSLPKRYKKLFILDEFRGHFFNESSYSNDGKLITKLKIWVRGHHVMNCYRKMQKDNFIHYTAVSYSLRDIEVHKDGFDGTKISVHPNIAASYFVYDSQKREEVRRELGIKANQILVVTSSGESGPWQKDSNIFQVLINKGYVVLNLSKNKVDLPNVISRFVPHKEMPAYLSACDAALLWRERISLNNVACPSKFGEFAVMGLYAIHNKSVDIVTKFIRDNNCGLLVDDEEEIELNTELFTYQERIRRCKAGFKLFSIEEIAKSYYIILNNNSIVR